MLNTFKFYGANRIFKIPDQRALIPVSWSHGIIWGEFDPGVLFSQQDSLASVHLLANEDEFKMCPFNGKKIITGLPIIYHLANANDHLGIDRLYVPRHGISGEGFRNDLDQLTQNAHEIGACSVLLAVPEFYRLSKTEDSFVYNGIKFLKGAHSSDPSSLSRIASIFKSTKIVYTDCLGSHIYYGSLFGCSLEVSTDSIEIMDKLKIARVLKSYPRSHRQVMEEYFLNQGSKLRQLNGFLSLNKINQFDVAARICGLEYHDLSVFNSVRFNLIEVISYRCNLLFKKIISKC